MSGGLTEQATDPWTLCGGSAPEECQSEQTVPPLLAGYTGTVPCGQRRVLDPREGFFCFPRFLCGRP